METRANFIAIGLFVLGVTAAVLGFVYWLYASPDQGRQRTVEIVFPEAVTGLSVGSQVLFNGIRVGDVTRLGFPAGGGPNVIAQVRINEDAPVKTDTSAELGFQGLTGVAYVSLTGGSVDAPSLFAQEGNLRIVARVSRFQSILESGQGVLTRADQTLANINTLLSDNQDRISNTVENVERFSSALSDSAPQISGLIEDVSSAARALAAAGPGIQNVISRVDDLIAQVTPQQIAQVAENLVRFTEEAASLPQEINSIVEGVRTAANDLQTFTGTANRVADRVEEIVGAVEPEAVARIVNDGAEIATAFAQRTDAIGTLIDNVGNAAGAIAEVAQTVADRNDRVATIIDDAAGIAGDLRVAAAEVPGIVDGLRPGLDNLGNVLTAIDPDTVSRLVTGASNIAQTLDAERERIASLIANADAAAGSIAEVAGAVSARTETIDTIIDDAADITANVRRVAAEAPDIVESLRPGLDNLSAILAEISPARIDDIVTNIQIVTGGIAQRSEQLGSMIDDAAATLSNARAITDTVAARNDQIIEIINNAELTARNAETLTARLSGLADSLRPGVENIADVLGAIDPDAVGALVDSTRAFIEGLEAELPGVSNLIQTANAAATDIQTVTESVAGRTEEIETIIDGVASTTTNAEALSTRLNEIAETLQPGIANIADVLGAIDPDAVGALVDSAVRFLNGLEAEVPNVSELIASANAAVSNVQTITETVASRNDQIIEIINNAELTARNAQTLTAELTGLAETARPGVENIADVLGAIDPDAVGAIFDNIRAVTETVAGQRAVFGEIVANVAVTVENARSLSQVVADRQEAINETISNARTLSVRLNEIAVGVQPAIDEATELLAALDADNINAITAGVRDVVETVASRREDIEATIQNARAASDDILSVTDAVANQEDSIQRIIANVETASGELQGAITRIASTVERLGVAIEGPGVRFLEEGSVAAAEIAVVARAFAQRADSIASGVNRFANAGLDDVRALVDQGESTLSRIERAVVNFDNAPNRIIFGGERGPVYSPQRR